MRVAVAVHGPPRDPATWSGSSLRLVTALEAAGADVTPVDAVPRWLDRLEQAASVDPDPQRWRQRHHANASALSPLVRAASSRTARHRLGRAGQGFDAVLQVGHWYDLAAPADVPARVRCSYHDGNLALNLRRPDLRLDPGAPAVRRALAFERGVARRMDLVLAMSAWLAASFREDYGVAADRVVVAGFGANLEPPATLPVRRADPPRLLFVGRSWARKGGPVLLEAFAVLRREHPGATLTLVGPPRDPGGGPDVTWLGPIDRGAPGGEERLRRAYEEATAFVMPSLFEPFGSAFLEAMAHGLPCVGTTCCAMPEAIQDGRTGLLAAPGDAGALADRLRALAADPARAAAMGRAGRERFDARFRWPQVARRILGALDAHRPALRLAA
jgi:glycosyltransferase involved in cell wall biosynthesis